MPRVPTVDGPSASLNPTPNAYQTDPRGLGGAQRAQEGQFQLAANAASAYADMLRKQQDELDQVRVDDAINQLKERQLTLTFDKDAGFVGVRGIAALQRESGQPLAEEYGQQLQDTASKITDGLGNDRQKRLFQLKANDIVTGFRGQVLQHEGEQSRVYVQSVREGTIANRQNEVSAFWNDPVRIDDALVSIESAVADMGRNLGGKSAEWITAKQREETSKAVAGAVSNALEQNDFVAADTLLKRYAERMTAADLVRARTVVDKQIDAGIAQHVATQAVRSVAPTIQPTDMDRVIGITLQSESGGQRFGRDGALLTSPKGAKGEMQVLDATSRDPGFGVTPARDGSPEERARVGRDYLAAMIQRYDGDLAMAWAAYNAGPGRVDTELREAAKRGAPGAWLSNMPSETQDYVRKNVAAYNAGGGAPARATLEDVHNAVRARIGEGHPQRLKLALDEATRQYDDQVKAVKQREDEAVANAQRWLATNGGRWTAMPATLRAAVPPGQVDNLLNFSSRVARGEDRTNPAVYQRLSDPDVLRSLSDAEFFTVSMSELSEADRKHFANERSRLIRGAAGDKPGDLNTGAVKTLLDTRLRELGVDPTPKDDGGADAQRIGAIRQFVDRSLLASQASAGKKFSDAEVQKHIDGLFTQTDVASGWFSDTSKPMLTMKVGDIPGKVKDRLKADFKAAGIDEPTDGQLLGAYWTAKSAAARRQITPLVPRRGTAGGQ